MCAAPAPKVGLEKQRLALFRKLISDSKFPTIEALWAHLEQEIEKPDTEVTDLFKNAEQTRKKGDNPQYYVGLLLSPNGASPAKVESLAPEKKSEAPTTSETASSQAKKDESQVESQVKAKEKEKEKQEKDAQAQKIQAMLAESDPEKALDFLDASDVEQYIHTSLASPPAQTALAQRLCYASQNVRMATSLTLSAAILASFSCKSTIALRRAMVPSATSTPSTPPLQSSRRCPMPRATNQRKQPRKRSFSSTLLSSSMRPSRDDDASLSWLFSFFSLVLSVSSLLRVFSHSPMLALVTQWFFFFFFEVLLFSELLYHDSFAIKKIPWLNRSLFVREPPPHTSREISS
jgi:hypothetical protein